MVCSPCFRYAWILTAFISTPAWAQFAQTPSFMLKHIFTPYFIGASAADKETDNDLSRVPYYTGAILPTPQSVTYFDEFISLSNAAIVAGADIGAAAPPLKFLTERIRQYGGRSVVATGATQGCTAIIAIGATELGKSVPAPDKPEGYVIANAVQDGVPVVILKAADKLGLLWSIVSLNQLISSRDGKCVLRKADVNDFPVYRHRGFIAGSGRTQWLRDMASFKLNVMQFYTHNICAQLAPQWKGHGSGSVGDPDFWRKAPPQVWMDEIARMGELLTPLGIDWYVGLSPIRGQPENKIDSKSEKDFQAIMAIALPIAKAGGGLHLHCDDTRFPINEADKKNFGSAREADVYFINKLYAAVKKDYPGFKMTFCPPFYWGPGYDPTATYGEEREAYLKALGDRLPPEIGIYWTGNSVWCGKVVKKQVDWIVERIKRKPWFWQNGTGIAHMYGYHYGTDPVDVWAWHYDGFYNDVLYTFPGAAAHSVLYLTMADYMWNPKAYDKDHSVREAAGKMCGAESWDTMVEMNRALSAFDPYEGNVSPGAARELPNLKKALAEAEAASKKFNPQQAERVKARTYLYAQLQRAKTLVARLEKNPQLAAFTGNIDALKALAKSEAGYDSKTDVFLSPYDFNGGKSPATYGFGCEPRVATWIYGTKTDIHTLSSRYRVTVPPSAETYDLIVCGQDDDGPDQCKIRILVNDNIVFEGANPLKTNGWYRHIFKVKGAFLKEGENTVVIKNIEEGSGQRMGPPYFMLNYAILKSVQGQ